MQYLLTEQEYGKLLAEQKDKVPKAVVAAMRQMIVGENCIHTETGRKSMYRYCDNCPLSHVGWRPVEERGKLRPSRELSKQMCDLPRNYSQ